MNDKSLEYIYKISNKKIKDSEITHVYITSIYLIKNIIDTIKKDYKNDVNKEFNSKNKIREILGKILFDIKNKFTKATIYISFRNTKLDYYQINKDRKKYLYNEEYKIYYNKILDEIKNRQIFIKNDTTKDGKIKEKYSKEMKNLENYKKYFDYINRSEIIHLNVLDYEKIIIQTKEFFKNKGFKFLYDMFGDENYKIIRNINNNKNNNSKFLIKNDDDSIIPSLLLLDKNYIFYNKEVDIYINIYDMKQKLLQYYSSNINDIAYILSLCNNNYLPKILGLTFSNVDKIFNLLQEKKINNIAENKNLDNLKKFIEEFSKKQYEYTKLDYFEGIKKNFIYNKNEYLTKYWNYDIFVKSYNLIIKFISLLQNNYYMPINDFSYLYVDIKVDEKDLNDIKIEETYLNKLIYINNYNNDKDEEKNEEKEKNEEEEKEKKEDEEKEKKKKEEEEEEEVVNEDNYEDYSKFSFSNDKDKMKLMFVIKMYEFFLNQFFYFEGIISSYDTKILEYDLKKYLIKSRIENDFTKKYYNTKYDIGTKILIFRKKNILKDKEEDQEGEEVFYKGKLYFDITKNYNEIPENNISKLDNFNGYINYLNELNIEDSEFKKIINCDINFLITINKKNYDDYYDYPRIKEKKEEKKEGEKGGGEEEKKEEKKEGKKEEKKKEEPIKMDDVKDYYILNLEYTEYVVNNEEEFHKKFLNYHIKNSNDKNIKNLIFESLYGLINVYKIIKKPLKKTEYYIKNLYTYNFFPLVSYLNQEYLKRESTIKNEVNEALFYDSENAIEDRIENTIENTNIDNYITRSQYLSIVNFYENKDLNDSCCNINNDCSYKKYDKIKNYSVDVCYKEKYEKYVEKIKEIDEYIKTNTNLYKLNKYLQKSENLNKEEPENLNKEKKSEPINLNNLNDIDN